MSIRFWIRRFSKTAHPGVVLATGAALCVFAYGVRAWVHQALLERLIDDNGIQAGQQSLAEELAEYRALRDLKARDIRQFKDGLSKLTESKRAIYEAGLFLQEDKRLLEKQWEILSTYFLVDESSRKIHMMRGEQSLESHALGHAPQNFGGESKPLTGLSPIVSKERFAHPERGTYEEVNGQLQWNPPQVGTSLRANALGEYVMFTRGPLVLHGPPKKIIEHDDFPHYCLGLSLPVARRLYAGSFIGTKILFKSAQAQNANQLKGISKR
jgi:hypothetical protein